MKKFRTLHTYLIWKERKKPDSVFITFVRVCEKNSELYLLDPEARNRILFLLLLFSVADPEWIPIRMEPKRITYFLMKCLWIRIRNSEERKTIQKTGARSGMKHSRFQKMKILLKNLFTVCFLNLFTDTKKQIGSKFE